MALPGVRLAVLPLPVLAPLGAVALWRSGGGVIGWGFDGLLIGVSAGVLHNIYENWITSRSEREFVS